MSIQIKKSNCIGCGACQRVCPGNLISLDEDQKAYIKRPKDCWGCTSCLKECHQEAILFYLGADMGGQGGVLTTTVKEGLRIWTVVVSNCHIHVITVDPKESNEY